jgi:hypothetical protein
MEEGEKANVITTMAEKGSILISETSENLCRVNLRMDPFSSSPIRWGQGCLVECELLFW